MSGEWYYDTETHQVSEGKESGWESRMGPYPTREAAESALETVKARNDAWDAEED